MSFLLGFTTLIFNSGKTASFLLGAGHGFSSFSLFFLIGLAYTNTGSRILFYFSGLFNAAISFSIFFSISLLFSASIPVSLSFFSEFVGISSIVIYLYWLVLFLLIYFVVSLYFTLFLLLSSTAGNFMGISVDIIAASAISCLLFRG